MKILKNITVYGKKLSLALLLSLLTTIALAQDPPPPPGGGGTSDTRDGNNQLGGNAPVGEGILFLFALGTAYAGRKLYVIKKL